VFQSAANTWASLLPGNVEIHVHATFDPLFCGGGAAILGSAGPVTVHAGFTGAIFRDAWYHASLANRLAEHDLSPTQDEIQAQFNVSVDDATCLGSSDWYYGLDGNEGSNVDLYAVVLHELGHGLGFSTLVDVTTGTLFNGKADAFSHFIFDNASGLHWNEMTDAQRQASAIHTGQVVWDGAAVRAHAPSVLFQPGIVRVDSPPAIAGAIGFGRADFGAPLASPGITAQVVLANDGSGTTSDACEPITNGGAIAGRIALIDRGICAFTTKVAAAQAAGAIAAVIVNNTSGAPPEMPGTDASITIPSVMISQNDGNAIKAQLGTGVTMTLTGDPARLSGADASGRPLLYAPNPVLVGSSISHWDISATPDLLMEPVITADMGGTVDLTLDAFEDLGWGIGGGGGETPPAAQLGNPYPNPFGPSSTMQFSLLTGGEVDITVHDLSGRLVRRLFHGTLPAGPSPPVSWDGLDEEGRRARQGVYLCRLSIGGFMQARRMVRVE
jgi:hypothetical protein